jgi:predicted RNA-binding Zn-ribbon protein involved in translation (DUF1610 family)
MAISFSCHQCGRNLKAPDDAVGKSSKCPGCGATVTCPDAVYDAELQEAPAAGAVAYDVPDPDGAYAMAAPPVEAAVAQEVRRPCPMCGEMIIATAAKCRFCGEVFDETLKKASLGGKEAKAIASAQRNLVVSILLWLVCAVGSSGLQRSIAANRDPAMSLVVLIVAAIGLAGYVGVASYIFVLARRMYNVGVGILLAFLAIIPCVNLLIAFMVNQRVNRYLQDNGYEVGLFGAKVP